MSEKTTITLSAPITFAQHTIGTLEMRAAVAGDLRTQPLYGRHVGDNLNLASALCGEHVALLDLMKPVDLAAVNKVVNEMLSPIMAAGAPEGAASPKAGAPYTLKTPLLIDGRPDAVTTLTFREAIARDMRGIPVDAMPTIGHLLDVGARLSGCDAAVMNKLDIPDLAEVLTIVGGFISAGLGMSMTP